MKNKVKKILDGKLEKGKGNVIKVKLFSRFFFKSVNNGGNPLPLPFGCVLDTG